ncbi:MAG: putative periplasmic or secreted lipoprotein [Flavipsychrobacter sp.]|jgi:predicted RNA binding protein YcfA (HicA-like mRNA interferase family)|nr:putative periplasmic or secreted lipoprotein [Flavipsychrobacter sp.]
MSKLPVTDAKNLEKILLKLGFKIVRQKGSHRFYRHDDGRYTTIPHHGHEDLGQPLIREILKQVELTPEEYQQMLK